MLKERLKKWVTAKIKWPAFGPTVDRETCLNICADKVIKKVSTALANGGDDNLHEAIKNDLLDVFFTGGELRIKRIHRRIRNLEIDIRSGKV